MTQFLHPTSVRLPSQGAYSFIPEVSVFDEATPQDLEDAMNASSGIQALDPDNYYVVEHVQYQVYVTPLPMQQQVRYSALVHATKVVIE